MPRFAAFLRGVTPTNCKMAELRRVLEAAGYTNVVTVLASGNVVFDARSPSQVEAVIEKGLKKNFLTLVRPLEALSELLEADPWRRFDVDGAKCVVTFLSEPPPKLKLPIERDGARILQVRGLEALSAYRPSPRGPVFMTLIEKTFGKQQTTRTWDTLKKVVTR